MLEVIGGLMERKGFIGGSDLYNILRGDWHDLWLVKTGRKQPDDLSHIFKVNLGNVTERYNLEWLSKDTGLAIADEQSVAFTELLGVPFKGQADAIGTDEQGVRYLIECKHTSSNRSMNQMLDSYMPQIQLYMCLFQLKQAYLSVIFGNEHDYCTVDYNQDYLHAVVTKVAEFWQLVTSDTEPSYDLTTFKIDWSAININGLKLRDASKDNHFTSLASDFVSTVDTAKEHEAIKKELRSLVADDEREVFCDLLTIKRDKRGACRITVKEGDANHG